MAGVLTISTRIVVKTGAIRNFGPGAPACKRSPAPSIQQNLRRRPRTGKPAPSLRLAMSLRACPAGGGGFRLLPSFLLVFGSNARTPKWGRRIQANEKKHRTATTPLNGCAFLSHGPIVRVEDNEVRSVMEAPSGLLSAMRVLSRADRLSFVQAVAPCFVGHDALCRLRDILSVAPRLGSATTPSGALANVVSLAHLPGRDCDGQSACGHQQYGKFNG